MRLMNLRLDNMLFHITGKSGMTIITAILNGERDGHKLAMFADRRVKNQKKKLPKLFKVVGVKNIFLN